jgi:hypothetical protein
MITGNDVPNERENDKEREREVDEFEMNKQRIDTFARFRSEQISKKRHSQ